MKTVLYLFLYYVSPEGVTSVDKHERIVYDNLEICNDALKEFKLQNKKTLYFGGFCLQSTKRR